MSFPGKFIKAASLTAHASEDDPMSDFGPVLCPEFARGKPGRKPVAAVPRLALRFQGNGDFRERADAILADISADFEWHHAAGESHILVLRSDPYSANDAAKTCHDLLGLAGWLLKASPEDLRCESSGVVHSREAWMASIAEIDAAYERFAQPIGSPRDILRDSQNYWRILYRTLVHSPIDVFTTSYTCGMHLLGKPDFILNREFLSNGPMSDAAPLFEELAVHLLTEKSATQREPFHSSVSGALFTLSPEVCTGLDRDDGQHNPFGRWRLS